MNIHAIEEYTSIRYAERLSESGIATSIGSAGDCYDNVLAETIYGHKAEVVYPRRFKGRSDVELATLHWVDWYNYRRLVEHIGNNPSAGVDGRGTLLSVTFRVRHCGGTHTLVPPGLLGQFRMR